MEQDQNSNLKKEEENKSAESKSSNEVEKKEIPISTPTSDPKPAKKGVNISAIMVLVGVFLGVMIAGSFGVDFFKDKRKIDTAKISSGIYEDNGKTWVAFSDPIINVEVISDKNCEKCNYEETIKILKMNLAQTLKVNEVEFDSEEGKKLISSFGIKSIPAFVFDSNITKAENYNKDERIKQVFIEKENKYYLDSAKVGFQAGKYLDSLKASNNDASKGPKDAKVTIIEFSDFQCPYCQKAKETVDEIMKEYGDKVRLVFKNFPLQFHNNAQKAAEAAECANDQGKFWEMHDYMFANQDKLAVTDLKKAAKNLGLNASDFDSCLDSGKYEGKIKSDIATGTSFGISGTPAFFINDQFLNGAVPIEDFKKIIDEELAK